VQGHDHRSGATVVGVLQDLAVVHGRPRHREPPVQR
jgi:hypothetical protein